MSQPEPILNGLYTVSIHHAQRNDRPYGTHTSSELTYILFVAYSGWATLHSKTIQKRCRAPCAFLIPPGQNTSVECPPASRWEQIKFDVVATPLKRRGDGRQSMEHRSPTVQPPPSQVWGCEPTIEIAETHLDACLETVRFCGQYWWQDVRGHARANARLQWWLTDYVTSFLNVRNPLSFSGDPWLERVVEFIRLGMSSGITASDLASSMGMSRETFRTRITSRTRFTPGNLITSVRMMDASRRLDDTELSISDIAQLCGYRSLAAFSRAFKRHHGIGPGQYRKRRTDPEP